MHYTSVKGILSANNGLNIYRGCEHGCIYCDSRSKCYNMEHDFEDIEVKENALDLLEIELSKKRKKTIISTGSMSDPYMPLEKQLGMTRKMLEIIYKYGYGVHLQTKSSLILRDLDLLKKINQQTKVRVSITLTTYDEELCKKIEPNVSTTKERFEVLKKLHEAGIETYVWLSPILPFINDTLDNLRGILSYCKEAHVTGIICFGFGVTLREGDREYFYQKLDELFPKLKREYIKAYGNAYECNSRYHKYLYDFFTKFCEREGILYHLDSIFKRIHTLYEEPQYTQLSLFEEN
ncbi:MAG: radical SAM protein [Anaeroplasmataceae bacterium]|nr:radical SAM protein [Anaeroplasmataceae bacterium]